MSVLDRRTLEESTLADLHAIASELSIDGYRRLRKSDLVDTILAHQGGEQPPERPERDERPARSQRTARSSRGARAAADADDASDEPDRDRSASDEATVDDEDEEDAAAGSARRRRGRRGGRGRTTGRNGRASSEEAEEAEAADESQAPAPARPARSNGAPSRRAGTGAAARTESERSSSDRAAGGAGAPSAEQDEPETVEGVVELLANGSGFVRVSPPEPSDEDVYISAAQVKRCELVNGDRVTGPRRPPHRSERYPSLVRIDTVNGRPADELADRGRFDDLPAEFPTERFRLGSDDATLKAVELLTPFGRGSRVTIAGGPWSGKSHLLRLLAAVLSEQEEITVFVALAGVRPEELGEWAEGPVKPGAAVSFASSAEARDSAVELVVDQARRLAARGSDAVVMIDTLDGMHPLSARRALGSARKLREGGSLTVIATASGPLGGETTVIALDAALAISGRHPALDLNESGTLRPELLVGEAGVKAIVKERAKASR